MTKQVYTIADLVNVGVTPEEAAQLARDLERFASGVAPILKLDDDANTPAPPQAQGPK